MDHISGIALSIHSTHFLDPDSADMQAFSLTMWYGGLAHLFTIYSDSTQHIFFKHTGLAWQWNTRWSELSQSWWKEGDFSRSTEINIAWGLSKSQCHCKFLGVVPHPGMTWWVGNTWAFTSFSSLTHFKVFAYLYSECFLDLVYSCIYCCGKGKL